MRLDSLQTCLSSLLAIHLGLSPGFAAGASPAIGTVMTRGAFRLNNATLVNNATLFEGATIETGSAVSRMQLSSGTRMEMGPESKGRFFGDHLVLERGESRIDKADGFRVEARGLTIRPDTGGSTARVSLSGNTRVQVAALTGSFRVLNSRGMVVAKIPSGKTLALDPQSVMGPTRLTGRLVNRSGHFLVTDETTNVTMEVRGTGLAKETGRRVEVTGSAAPAATPASDATQVILVAQLSQAPTAPTGGGGTPPAGPAGTGEAGGTAGGASGGASAGTGASVTMIAIIGGVVAAAVVGGLAATGTLGGNTPVTVSR